MPISQGTTLQIAAQMIAGQVVVYNGGGLGPAYNAAYNDYILARSAGIATNAGLVGWIDAGGAGKSIQALLDAYGMNARNSVLVSNLVLHATLGRLDGASIGWIENVTLPLMRPPSQVANPSTGATLSSELATIYNTLAAPGAVTTSGGFVASSKTMHCLFPNLAPMIDGAHTGLSYYNIVRRTYVPPMGLPGWAAWHGWAIRGVPNPSPRGAGRNSWGADQLLAAIGVNQHLYEIWSATNGNAGLPDFLALDPTAGTTGIPRIVDKGLW